MNTARATAKAEIRAQVDSWLQAVLAMDIDGIVSHYAPDILAFDTVEPCGCLYSEEAVMHNTHDPKATLVRGGTGKTGRGVTARRDVGAVYVTYQPDLAVKRSCRWDQGFSGGEGPSGSGPPYRPLTLCQASPQAEGVMGTAGEIRHRSGSRTGWLCSAASPSVPCRLAPRP
jgi:hypothetical protein